MAGSISPWPVVTSGANGHPIKTLQYLLRAGGHGIAVDGVFGPQTEAAVKALQSGHGLVANGIVDAATGSLDGLLFSAPPVLRHARRDAELADAEVVVGLEQDPGRAQERVVLA